jgi:hypothetical protein
MDEEEGEREEVEGTLLDGGAREDVLDLDEVSEVVGGEPLSNGNDRCDSGSKRVDEGIVTESGPAEASASRD